VSPESGYRTTVEVLGKPANTEETG
jgi:hypothetical protein